MSRNSWKWIVPLGCFTSLVLALSCFVGLILIVFQGMKSTWAYGQAMALAEKNPAVVSALGSPIQSGWFVSGSIRVNGSSGDADLAIPISGPKGAGTLYAVATKHAGEWQFEKVEVEVPGRATRIPLLAAKPMLPEERQKDADPFDEGRPDAEPSLQK